MIAWPATGAQTGMLFHSMLEPRAGMYCQQVAMRFRGDLDVPRFERAWHATAARHSALRSCFEQRPGGFVQRVRPEARMPFTFLDWRGSRNSLSRYAARDRERGFHPECAPLSRVTVLQTGQSDFRVQWSFHHSLLDGWSLGLVLSDLFEIYRGQGAALPAAPDYAAYVDWLSSRDMQEADAFWRQRLQGFSAPTPLPGLRGHSWPSSGTRFESVRKEISELDAVALYQEAKRSGITLASVVQAAWGLVLGRAACRDDVVFGQCVAGRSVEVPGIESITGMLMNTVPARLRLRRNGTLTEWLKDFQKDNLRTRRYEWTPLPRIQAVSEISRPSPLFHSLVVMENYPLRERTLPVSDLRVRGWTNYPLSITVLPWGNCLSLQFDYARQHFDRISIKTLAEQFVTLLVEFAKGFNRRIRNFDAPRRVSTVSAGTPNSFAELFLHQVGRTPGGVAVSYGFARLTYAELDRRSDAVAATLRLQGAGPGCIIGIGLERSIEFAVWLAAVLKSGSAFLPLPPAWPAPRLRTLIQEAQPRFVLINQASVSRFSEMARTLAIETKLLNSPSRISVQQPPGSAPGYLLYTSGSTGTPKGVQVSHAALAGVLLSMQSLLQLRPGDQFLALTDLCFDVSLIELLLPLICGATVRLATLDPTCDVASVVREAEQATCLQATPTVWNLLLDAGWQSNGSMKLLCGGEVLTRKLAQRLLRNGDRVWNLYGPTEAVIWSTAYELAGVAGNGSMPIGKPLAHALAYVVDQSGQPVAHGEPGELYLGGTLAQGYLDRPAATAERFIPDPFSGVPGARVYATGDRVRQSPDGRLEFLGRSDTQTKIRGMRMELAEIEAALEQHPSIRRAAVVATEGVLLAAYSADHDIEALRDFLNDRLPEPMVPSRIVRTDSLPLAVGGKLDRGALALFLASPPQPNGGQPSNGAESALAAAFQEVLSSPAGPHDDFFALGGDSIKCLLLVARLRDSGYRITPRLIFQHPLLSDLARLLRPLAAQASGGTEA